MRGDGWIKLIYMHEGEGRLSFIQRRLHRDKPAVKRDVRGAAGVTPRMRVRYDVILGVLMDRARCSDAGMKGAMCSS